MMRKLIKETFELFVKKIWLKKIDKEVDKYNRIKIEANRQAHVVHSLVNRYNEIYKNDPIAVSGQKEVSSP